MDSAVMEASEVEALAKQLRLKLYRTCVKDDLNVSEIFQHLGVEFVRTGGEAAYGQGGIASIDDVASKPLADWQAAASGKGNAASTEEAGTTPLAADRQQSFKLTPAKVSVQR